MMLLKVFQHTAQKMCASSREQTIEDIIRLRQAILFNEYVSWRGVGSLRLQCVVTRWYAISGPQPAEPEPKVHYRLRRVGTLLFQGFAPNTTYDAPKIFV